MAERVAIGPIDLAIGFKVDVLAPRNAVHADRGGQTLSIKKHIVALHFFDSQGVGRQWLIAVRIDRYAARENVGIPASDLGRNNECQYQDGQTETIARQERKFRIADDQPGTDQKIHHDRKDDGVLHA